MGESKAVLLSAVIALGLVSCLPSLAQAPAAAAASSTEGAGWDQPALRGQSPPASTTAPALSPASPTSSNAAPAKTAAAEEKPTTRRERIRKDSRIAWRMAGDPMLYKIAAADPSILEVICDHPLAAWRVARNRHLGELAECDHYLCRRLTHWRMSTWALVKNPQADRVIALDPEGIYRAINRDPGVAHALAKNIQFNQMVTENPDLGKFIAQHM